MKNIDILKKIAVECLIVLIMLFYNSFITAAGEFGGSAGFMYGAKLANINDLNEQLTRDGLGEFDPVFASMGGFGYIDYNRFVFSPDFGIYSKKTSSENVDINYKVSRWFLNFGYIVVSEERAKGFVFVGAGMGNGTLEFNDKSGEIITFAEEDINSGGKLEAAALLINLGYSYHFLMNFSKSQTSKRGLSIGIRTGYVFTPGGKKWKYNDTEITGAPDVNFNGVYIRLAIGGWLNKISE